MLRKAIFLRASFWSREGTAAFPLMLSSSLGWIVRVDSIKRCLGLSLTQGLCCCILLLLCVDGGFLCGYGTVFLICSCCGGGSLFAAGACAWRMGARLADQRH